MTGAWSSAVVKFIRLAQKAKGASSSSEPLLAPDKGGGDAGEGKGKGRSEGEGEEKGEGSSLTRRSTNGGGESGTDRLAAQFVNELKASAEGTPEKKLFGRLRQHSIRGRVDDSQVRRFIIRLATALHAYGSSAPRTEYLVDKVAERLGQDVDIGVFPALIILSFNDGTDDSLDEQTIVLPVAPALDVDKLGRVDQLALAVSQDKHQVLVAYWQLRAIATAKPTFSLPYRMIALVIRAGAASRLFFGGTYYDAAAGSMLALAGGFIEHAAAKYSPVAMSVKGFLIAIFAAFTTRLIIALGEPSPFCFYPTSISALVWSLPGLALAQSVNEIVGKTFVAGSSRLVAAIFTAFQLGFGIAFGASLVFWDKLPLDEDCAKHVPKPPLAAKIVLFLLCVMANNVRLNARLEQWPGMVITASAGYSVAQATAQLGKVSSTIVVAIAVSVAGTICSRLQNQPPLAMKFAGIMVLVPGAIGISGVTALLQNSSSGASFVFEMLMVALAITLGLLIGRIFFPEGLFGYSSRRRLVDKDKFAAAMEGDRFVEQLGSIAREEEGMAF